MALIMTALSELVSIAQSALTQLAGMWVVAIPAAFFIIGLAVKFIFGLLGRSGGKSRKR